MEPIFLIVKRKPSVEFNVLPYDLQNKIVNYVAKMNWPKVLTVLIQNAYYRVNLKLRAISQKIQEIVTQSGVRIKYLNGLISIHGLVINSACTVCGYTFTEDNKNFKDHAETHFTCCFCYYCCEEINQKSHFCQYRKNKKGKHFTKYILPRRFIFKCGLCLNRFFIWESLSIHRARVHSHAGSALQYAPALVTTPTNALTDKIDSIVPQKDKREKLECNICGLKYSSKSSLSVHKANKHSSISQTISCFCGRTFSNMYKYRCHQNRAHSTQSYHCDICGRLYKSKANLTIHKDRHSQEKFICNICGKEFLYRTNLCKHMNSAHGTRNEKNVRRGFVVHIGDPNASHVVEFDL